MPERVGLLVADDFLVLDLEALGQALVQEPPFLWASLQVSRLGSSGQRQRQVKRPHGLVVIDAQAVDALLGTDALPFDALLLLGKQGLADLVGVVGGEELAFLLFKLGELGFRLGDLLSGQRRQSVYLSLEGLTNLLAVLVAQLLVGVSDLNRGLHRLDAMGPLGAVAVLTTTADEVLVFAAPAFGA